MEDLLNEEIVKLEEELTKLKSAVEYIETAKISIEAASKIINTIVKLREEFDKLSARANLLIDKMNKDDFPARFEKIDSRINLQVNELQGLQQRIETVNKSIVIESKATSKNITTELNEIRNNILLKLDKQSKDIRLITYGVIVTFIIIIILVLSSFIK